jgi:hypothetical protein
MTGHYLIEYPFGLLRNFLIMRFRSCIFYETITGTVPCSCILVGGIYDLHLSLYWLCWFDHLIKEVSVRLLVKLLVFS